MPHVLTIDYECWPQMVYAEATGQVRAIGRDGLWRATDRLLELLARHRVKATVFLLGVTAEAFPDLAASIADAGHEIGCHGYRHLRVDTLDAARFEAELGLARSVIESATGQVPVGFRAPYFSIRRGNLWALDVLARTGFRYDSSIFPIHHRRYGIPGWPREPHRVAGGRLVELPPATLERGRVRLPIAGGGYWRALPRGWVAAGLSELEAAGRSAVLYLHPFQLDAAAPASLPGPLGLLQRARVEGFRLAQSFGRACSGRVLEDVLPRHEWITAAELANRFLTSSSAQPIHAAGGG